MYDIFGYIKKYGNVSFKDKEFNVIDSMIFSAITYIDYSNIVGKKKVNLSFALRNFLCIYSIKDYIRSASVEKETIKLAKLMIKSKRYSEVEVYNYEYKLTDVEQFGAITFKMPDGNVFVSYLGTDDNMVAWFEDFNMIHQFPVPAQKDAIKYLNKTVSLFDKKVFVGGHSKGGNLGLVAAMYCNPFIRLKIKKIISLDGPGLRYKEITSKRYKKVHERYEHIIPNYSVIGLLLRHAGTYKVVKSKSISPAESHLVFSWMLEDDNIKEVKLSSVSKKLDNSILIWLDEHDDVTRREMVYRVFSAIREAGITNVKHFGNLKNLYNLIKNIHGLDVGTKTLIKDFFKFNVGYLVSKKRD